MQTFDSSWLPKSFYVMKFESRKKSIFSNQSLIIFCIFSQKNVSIKKNPISHVARRGHMYDNFKHKF